MRSIDGIKNLDVPFSGSYWVIAEWFLAGCHPCFYAPYECPEILSRIVHAGIRNFIDLTQADERIPGGMQPADYSAGLNRIADAKNIALRHRRQPIIDRNVPGRAVMSQILDGINESISNHLPVYVHCMGGIGRTGTVVGCYLARHGYASGNEVIRYIADLRRHVDFIDWPSPESRKQVEMVVSWVKGE